MRYRYECRECEITFEIVCPVIDRHKQKCPKCGSNDIDKFIGSVVPIWTRDGFGVKNEFINSEGKTIDNWKTWEKEGYRNPLEVTQSNQIKEQIKEKIEKKSNKRRIMV